MLLIAAILMPIFALAGWGWLALSGLVFAAIILGSVRVTVYSQ